MNSPAPRPFISSLSTRVAAISLLALSLTACAGSIPSGAGTPDSELAPQSLPAVFGHVHGLDVDSVTGVAYAATHGGLFELPSAGATPIAAADLGGPIAGRAQDTMGFTINAGQMFGSGHPDPAEQSTAPNLGFITSQDGAQTWETLSLGGEADFHDIEVVRDAAGALSVYAVDARTGQITTSTDGGVTWHSGADVIMRDLSADPASGTVYATTEQGLAVSDDGGATFEVDPDAPVLYLIDWIDGPSADGLVGIDLEGTVWTRIGADGWQESGSVSGDAEAMAYSAVPEPVLLVADARGIVASDDFGATWRAVVER